MKTFEEYYEENIKGDPLDYSVLESLWNYQQDRIDAIREECDALIQMLGQLKTIGEKNEND